MINLMKMTKMLRFGLLLGAVFAVTYLPSTAQAQCAADPTGETPIGVVTKSNAKGPSLSGVLIVEFLNANGLTANGARISVRLRRGPTVLGFFALIPEYGCSDDHSFACDPDASPDPCVGEGLGTCQANLFDTETPQDTQEELLAALRDPVLGDFFPDECGPEGDLCPEVEAVLKRIEEFVIFDDFAVGGTSQFLIADIVVSTTKPL